MSTWKMILGEPTSSTIHQSHVNFRHSYASRNLNGFSGLQPAAACDFKATSVP
jgi:hypothetical protein